MNKIQDKWSAIHTHDKWYLGAELLITLSSIPMFLTNQQQPIIQISQYQYYIIFYSMFICWWIGGIFGIVGYIKQVKFEIREISTQANKIIRVVNQKKIQTSYQAITKSF